MKYFDWNIDKNEVLKNERGISFEDILIGAFEEGLLDIISHPNQKKYSNQKIMVVNVNKYVYLVPFVEDKEKIFLKTIIPSSKATKNYLIPKSKS